MTKCVAKYPVGSAWLWIGDSSYFPPGSIVYVSNRKDYGTYDFAVGRNRNGKDAMAAWYYELAVPSDLALLLYGVPPV